MLSLLGSLSALKASHIVDAPARRPDRCAISRYEGLPAHEEYRSGN
jgi:hypothetical protein